MRKYGLTFYIKSHCLLVLLILAVPAYCATNCQLSNSPAGCPILVQAAILPGCQIAGATTSKLGDINFGQVASLSSKTVIGALVLDSTISLNCTPNINLTISIDRGLYYDGSRNMSRSGGYQQPYQLYSDVALNNPIGIDQPITLITSSSGNNITLPVYAAVKLNNSQPPGNYTDTLTVVISW